MKKTERLLFTIIELLVVVAILGILMAIILPSLNRAKKSGNRANCVSNLKQIGIALQAYESSNEGWFPYNCTSQKLANPDRIFIANVLGLEKTLQVFYCPNDMERLYEEQGSSYLWNWTQIELPGNGRAGEARYDASPYEGKVPPENFALFSDAGAYHGKAGSKTALNVLYADFSVDNAGRIPFLSSQ